MHSLSSGPPQRIRYSPKSNDYANVFTGQHTSTTATYPLLKLSIPGYTYALNLAANPKSAAATNTTTDATQNASATAEIALLDFGVIQVSTCSTISSCDLQFKLGSMTDRGRGSQFW